MSVAVSGGSPSLRGQPYYITTSLLPCQYLFSLFLKNFFVFFIRCYYMVRRHQRDASLRKIFSDPARDIVLRYLSGFRRGQGLACGLRSGRGSDSPPGCHSTPRPSLRYPPYVEFVRIRHKMTCCEIVRFVIWCGPQCGPYG